MNNSKNILFFLTAAFIIFWFASQSVFGQEVETSNQNQAAQDETNFILITLKYYQDIVSKADGDRCGMHPSCSAYSVEASKKHGLIIGWIMTCDRLLRDGGDEMRLSPKILVNGLPHIYDPLENNDFWWD